MLSGDNTVRQSRKLIFVIACQVTMSCITWHCNLQWRYNVRSSESQPLPPPAPIPSVAIERRKDTYRAGPYSQRCHGKSMKSRKFQRFHKCYYGNSFLLSVFLQFTADVTSASRLFNPAFFSVWLFNRLSVSLSATSRKKTTIRIFIKLPEIICRRKKNLLNCGNHPHVDPQILRRILTIAR